MEEALNIHNYSFLEGEETKENGVIISTIVLCLALKRKKQESNIKNILRKRILCCLVD